MSAMEGDLAVWAERVEGFARVGTLSMHADGGESFSYDRSYLEDGRTVPIFPVLPLQEEPFGTQKTRSAFSSLGPEGVVGHDIRTALRAGREAISPVLARLNHETVGALTFTADALEPSYVGAGAAPLGDDTLFAFARAPEQTAFEELMRSRLSLNGAVAKIGVVRMAGAWGRPQGLAPSTHILKAGTPAFPHQMLNEALCMRSAVACGFDDAAQTDLMVIDDCDPILISRCFDRLAIDGRPAGLPNTMRLHQADFCQVLGISVDTHKYTPSDELVEAYTTSVASAISRESAERHCDRSYVFDMLVFDYLIGNCDNHLKNLSLTWSSDWSSKAVSPLYDVTCTTLYPVLPREMGLGIGVHRVIDEVEPLDFRLMARQLGISWKQARDSIAQTAEILVSSILESADKLEREHPIDAMMFAERLAKDCQTRVDVALKAAS